MKVAILYLTQNGKKQAEQMKENMEAELFGKEDWPQGLSAFLSERFFSYDGFIFIMAAGIVVRMIAPYLKGKTIDPAVVVMEEKGRFVISLLSGHIGGANELAKKIAAITGGQAVITTATDLNQKIAFDLFAKENHCRIENIEELKKISSAVLDGKKVGLFLDMPAENLPPYLTWNQQQEHNVLISEKIREERNINGVVLRLIPQKFVLGIGCKKNMPCEKIEEAVLDFMEKRNKRCDSLFSVASIELKKEEKGILEFCQKWNLPFLTLSEEFLKQVEQEFSYSDFVKEKVGVGNVCEACAAYAIKNSRLMEAKTVYPGITLALGEILYSYQFV